METLPPGAENPVVAAVLERLPSRLRRWVEWGLTRWPGRIVLRIAAASVRIELFDRSMTIAAQAFTSVFPVLILTASVFSGASDEIASALNMPPETESLVS